MTNNLFPEFQGWSWDKTKTPIWKTNIYEATSGKETRIQKWSYPRYKIQLTFNFMTDNSINGITLEKGDLEKLQGFFNLVGGPAKNFLFKDDIENTCVQQAFATGDGTNRKFQLVRAMPNWVEPICGIIEAPHIFVDNIETTNFTYDNNGLITFGEAPAEGAVLKWSGNYYFRVRFEDDELELTRSYDGLWESVEINMITVK